MERLERPQARMEREGVPMEPSQPHQGPGVQAGLPQALQTRTATGYCHRSLWDPKGTGSVGWGSIKEEIILEMSSTGQGGAWGEAHGQRVRGRNGTQVGDIA